MKKQKLFFNYHLPWWPVAKQPDNIIWLEICILGFTLFSFSIYTFNEDQIHIQLTILGFMGLIGFYYK